MDRDFLIKQHTQAETQRATRKFLKHREPKPIWREYMETAVVALMAAVLLRIFVVSAYRVNSGSMEDTLLTGDYIFVNKLAYEYGTKPQIGDVIVFKYPNNPERDYIKRIVAMGGQKVEIADKVVYVDDAPVSLPEGAKHIDTRVVAGQLSFRDNVAPIIVPPDEFYVMGDNRDDSKDSRFWGTVPSENIIGKAVFIYWSWEPLEDSPGWSFPYIHNVFQWLGHGIYYFPTHVRWDRLVTPISHQ